MEENQLPQKSISAEMTKMIMNEDVKEEVEKEKKKQEEEEEEGEKSISPLNANVIKRLQNLELIIEKMFVADSCTAAVERQILMMQELIAELAGDEYFAEQWREKVITFWHAFGRIRSSKIEQRKQQQHLTSDSIADDNAEIKIKILSTDDGNLRVESDPDFESHVRRQIETQFAPMPSHTEESVETMKRVLHLIGRTYRQQKKAKENVAVDEERTFANDTLYSIAFGKLPIEKQNQFLSTNAQLTLKNLIIFLRAEISLHYLTIRLTRAYYLNPRPLFRRPNHQNSMMHENNYHHYLHYLHQQRGGRLPTAFAMAAAAEAECKIVRCDFCQLYGHLIDACADIRTSVCFNCCERSHITSTCPNESIFDF